MTSPATAPLSVSRTCAEVISGLLLVGTLLVFGLVPLFDGGQRDMHDFRLFYLAAQTFIQGGNPYLQMVQHGPYELYYMYPTVTLYLFVPFTLLAYNTACHLFLVLKMTALTALVVVWSRFFLDRPGIWFMLFCLLAFNNALYIDFQVGNIEIFLQLLIWSGLALYVVGQYGAFSALILAAALFKITPMLLLGLLFIKPGIRRALPALAWPLAVFSMLLVVSVWLEPNWWMRLQTEVGRNTGGPAPYNQSFLNLVRDIARSLVGSTDNTLWPSMLFILYATLVACITAGKMRTRQRNVGDGGDPIALVMVGVLAYLLVLPRIQDYQFAMAIVPCYFIIQRSSLPSAPLLFILIVVQAANIRLPGLAEFYHLFFLYKLLTIVFFAWLYLAFSVPGSRHGLLSTSAPDFSCHKGNNRVESPSTPDALESSAEV